MSNHAILNNIDHLDLKVSTERRAELGDDLMCVQTFPLEFRNVQAEYPIFFSHHPQTNELQPLVMFGFEHGENLYLDSNGWRADYIPLMVEKGPFMIGTQTFPNEPDRNEPVLTIDLDSPRVSATAGESLFLPHGGSSEFTERMASVMQAVYEGDGHSKGLVAALEKHQLLEPFFLDIELDNGDRHRLSGFMTINEDKLSELDAEALAELNQQGYLQPIYMVIASLSNIRRLIAFKNQSLAE
ncbi:SapC family protein [Paraferrimonas sedimenticola]|uniref:Peptidase n=1 Tax=Paraferrimonas sedimenticola TaxID=375674 RepID=A0AA37RYT5_9GAMM|nr:SapC family protein [Paraferrimonas sedimenticola]GLP97636.1 peptidase [Paraferrimonas sedimenticola]